jgi:hypothetical protein
MEMFRLWKSQNNGFVAKAKGRGSILADPASRTSPISRRVARVEVWERWEPMLDCQSSPT